MNSDQYAAIQARIMSLYDLAAAGRWPEAEALLTEDFSITESDSLPFGGTWSGKDALQRLYAEVFGSWLDPDLSFHDLTISENHAIALLSFFATSRRTGERIEMKLAEVFHLEGDRISGITPYYFDTQMIAKQI